MAEEEGVSHNLCQAILTRDMVMMFASVMYHACFVTSDTGIERK
jgi:hypothetical protein